MGIGKLIASFVPGIKAAVVVGGVAATAGVATVAAAPRMADLVSGEPAQHAAPAVGVGDGPAADDGGGTEIAAGEPGPRDARQPSASNDASTLLTVLPDGTILLEDAMTAPQLSLPPPESAVGDTLAAVDGAAAGALETIDGTLGGALETVDGTLEGALTTAGDAATVVDETFADVEETLAGTTEPIPELAPAVGPPVLPGVPAEPEPTASPAQPGVLEPVDELPSLP